MSSDHANLYIIYRIEQAFRAPGGPDASTRLVTVIVGVLVALTFLFGFGNVVRHEVAQSEWTHRL